MSTYTSRTIRVMKNSTLLNKHQMKSEATRTALLQAAEAIFARDGFERAQIDEIAKESGRTRGAVYAQYKTKEQLFFALQEQRIEAAMNEFESLTAAIEKDDYKARLDMLKEYYSGLQDAHAAILDLELKLYALRHPESMVEWSERYRRIIPADKFAKNFGLKQEPGRSQVKSRVLALAALKSGLILATYFQPDQLGPKETKLLLSEVFEGLFPTKLIAEQPAKRAGRKPKKQPAK
jgi:AcrR family transcriptional regulator